MRKALCSVWWRIESSHSSYFNLKECITVSALGATYRTENAVNPIGIRPIPFKGGGAVKSREQLLPPPRPRSRELSYRFHKSSSVWLLSTWSTFPINGGRNRNRQQWGEAHFYFFNSAMCTTPIDQFWCNQLGWMKNESVNHKQNYPKT